MLPGDGVGPEVLAGPIMLLEEIAAAGRITISGPWPVGASAFGELGTGLPEPTRSQPATRPTPCSSARRASTRACRWTTTGPEHSIIGLRQRYDLRVSIRNIMRVDGGRGRRADR